MDPKIKNKLRDLALEASKQNDPLYVVGGTLRDSLLNREYSDLDLTCEKASHWAHWFAKHINSTCVVLHNKPGQEVLRVPMSKQYFCDFCTLLGNSLKEDLAHRDFTINALAQPLRDFLENGTELIDLFEGTRDLEEKTIRMLPGQPFQDDPLRMLRAFRQAATLDFKIEPDTLATVQKEAGQIGKVSGERISHELILFLGSEAPDPKQLLASGLFSQLIKNAGLSTPSNEALARDWEDFKTWWKNPELPLGKYQSCYTDLFSDESIRALFGLALLLSFLSGEEASEFLKHYKFSNRQIETVSETVNFCHVIKDYWSEKEEQPPETTLYQWAVIYEKYFFQGLLLAALAFPDNTDTQGNRTSFFDATFNFFKNRFLPGWKTKPLISGNDLQDSFKLKPSPLFKTLLDKTREAQVLGKISTREQAEGLIHELIKTLKEPS